MLPRSAFAPIVRAFSHHNYALFMGGMTPHLVTTWMQRVGVGWLAWELTESPTWLGVIAAADLAPMLVLAPFAGAITDRVVPLTEQKLMQVLSALQALALAALTLTGLMTIEILLGLTLFLGCVHPFASTARHAIVPATVPRDVFATAIALDSALFNASRFIGPAIAGLVIPFGGIGVTFAANTVGILVFLAALHAMDLPPPEREKRERRRILGDVGDGIAYVRAHTGIGPIMVLMVFASGFLRPLQDMLPGFSGDVFGAGAVGLAWMTSAMGVGAMLSAVWIATRGHVGGLTRVVTFGLLGLAGAVFGFVATDLLWVAVAFAALAGFSLNIMSTSGQALVQTAVEEEMRGRVMSLYTLIYRGLPAFGALGIGALAEIIGLRLTFAGAAAICLLPWLLAVPRQRTIARALEGERG